MLRRDTATVGFEAGLDAVTWKVREAVGPPPSVTVAVMSAVPAAAAFTVIVRLAPDPPSVMFPLGTALALLLEAVTVSCPAGVSCLSATR